ncbi:MAG: hypothetical protein ACRDF0_07110 [Candidatus Limnocylindria bacterium]
MAGHHDTAGADEQAIHLPPPSFSPALIGLAVTLIAFGILFGAVLIVAGGALFLVGLATWLIDDARAYLQAGDPRDGGHGH